MSRARRPFFRDKRVALAASLGGLALFWWALDDYTRHGAEQPKWIRWATWW